MAGNYYPVSTRIFITVPALPLLLPQTGSTSQIAGAGWAPSRDPHSQSPFYLGWARTTGCGDRPLPGGQQSAGWLTRAHGERGAPPTPGFSRKAHPDAAKLEGCCWYTRPACGLGSILFPSCLSCAGIPGLHHHAWLWNYISVFPSSYPVPLEALTCPVMILLLDTCLSLSWAPISRASHLLGSPTSP